MPQLSLAQKLLKRRFYRATFNWLGETNHYTAIKITNRWDYFNRQKGFLVLPSPGIAYGSYARSLLLPILDKLEKGYQGSQNQKRNQLEAGR